MPLQGIILATFFFLFDDTLQISVDPLTATGQLHFFFPVADTINTDVSGDDIFFFFSDAQFVLYAVDDNGTPDDSFDDARFTGVWNATRGTFEAELSSELSSGLNDHRPSLSIRTF